MATPFSPPPPIYPAGSRGASIVHSAAVVSIITAVATLVVVGVIWWKGRGPDHLHTIYALAALWAIVPAVWFWYEYFFVYRRYGNAGAFELFKHGQQTAIAIWAGVTLSLAAFASSDHFNVPAFEVTKCECKCGA